MPYEAALKLQERTHPPFARLILIEIIADDAIGKHHALAVIRNVATIGAALIAVVALAQHHDALAENATSGIVPAHKGLKENIHI